MGRRQSVDMGAWCAYFLRQRNRFCLTFNVLVYVLDVCSDQSLQTMDAALQIRIPQVHEQYGMEGELRVAHDERHFLLYSIPQHFRQSTLHLLLPTRGGDDCGVYSNALSLRRSDRRRPDEERVVGGDGAVFVCGGARHCRRAVSDAQYCRHGGPPAVEEGGTQRVSHLCGGPVVLDSGPDFGDGDAHRSAVCVCAQRTAGAVHHVGLCALLL
mmetsp:Transcript_1375/g.2680  ORF Transcript_1375/g.2680 Transcript_1375/m.2680 type:complete len:213 (+) Transcript_1375:511-1149(+)